MQHEKSEHWKYVQDMCAGNMCAAACKWITNCLLATLGQILKLIFKFAQIEISAW